MSWSIISSAPGTMPARDDVADCLAGVIHAFKYAEQRLASLRRARQPHQHARDDAEHPFAPDGRPRRS